MKKLMTHQLDVLRYTYKTRCPALFLDMRLGKTVVTVRRVRAYSDALRVLLVAPYSALLSWEQELDENGETHTRLTGTRAERLELLRHCKTKWCLINKEGHLALPELARMGWDCVILDESTFIKNPKSKVSKFFTKNFRDVKYKWILTGTPNPESDLDFYQQFAFLYGEQAFGCDSYWRFRQRHFQPLGFEWWPSTTGRRFIASYLAQRAYFLRRADVRDIKEKKYITRQVEMPASVRKDYKRVEKEFLYELPDGDLASTVFATEKYIWLRELASGFDPEHNLLWSGKIDEVINLLKGELAGQQVIIWASFVHELRALHTAISAVGECGLVYGAIAPVQRIALEKRFAEGKMRYFLANSECYKFGANLSTASAMLYFSNSPSYLTRSQSEDRIINLTKGAASLIIDLTTEKTVDEELQMSIKTKALNASMVRTIIKRMEERNEKAQ